MSRKVSIHWFRQDLRLKDNPGFSCSAKGHEVLPIYILDDVNSGDYYPGAASRWWLHYALEQLSISLKGNISIYKGDPLSIITRLVKKFNVSHITWNRVYEPWSISRDKDIKKSLEELGVQVNTFNGSLLWEPWDVLKSDGTPYKVFTPFYRRGCLNALAPREPIGKPKNIKYFTDISDSLSLESLSLLPDINWGDKILPHWKVGEKNAAKTLSNFISDSIQSYKDGRDKPSLESTSRLSPHLHFGEISPNQAWYAARSLPIDDNVDTFCSELGWREFAHSLLYYNPKMPKENLQEKFNKFPWVEDKEQLLSWQKGQTGIPMVDAGMRELWQTGFMHNRVRMIVGSFLVKNLRLHWNHGERWFWDCLVDADLPNNSAGWQWIAGCGVDAAPYFRVFNPVTQGQKFDQGGHYVRKYIPELKSLPDKYLFNPWEAPSNVLQEAGVVLGKTYPFPMVDLKVSRVDALSAFKSLSG